MKFRTTLVLLALVIGSLCVLIFHTTQQFGDRKHREQQMRVFPIRELLGPAYDSGPALQDRVARIAIRGGAESIVLTRDAGETTATWHIEKPFRALADPAQVAALIKAIEVMQATVILRDEPGSPLHLDTYGLAEPGRSITFNMNKESWELHIGNATADTRNAYVTRPGFVEVRVYVVPLESVAPFFMKASDVRDNAAIRFTRADTSRIKILAAGQPAIECRKANAEWTFTHPVADAADPRAILGLLDALGALRIDASNFVTQADARTLPLGLDNPSLSIFLADETHEQSLIFGTAVPDREAMVFAKRSEDGAIFALPKETMTALQRSLHDMRCKVALPIRPDAITNLSFSGGQEIHLRRTGEEWEMILPAGHVTDGFLVRAFLEDLHRIPVTRWIDNPTVEQLSQSGLDAPRLTLKATESGDLPEKTLFFGNLTPDGKLCHARRGSFGPILLLPSRILNDLAGGHLAFLSKTALEFNRGSATAIHMRHGEAEIRLEKRADKWTLTQPVARSADPTAVDEILWALCYIQAHKLLPASPAQSSEYGLNEPRMIVNIYLHAGPLEKKTLKIGKDCGDGSCYAGVEGEQNVFVISESVAKTLITNMNNLLNKIEVKAK